MSLPVFHRTDTVALDDENSQATQTQLLDDHDLSTGGSKSSGGRAIWGRLLSLNSRREHVELSKPSLSLGRSTRCDVVFKDESKFLSTNFFPPPTTTNGDQQ